MASPLTINPIVQPIAGRSFTVSGTFLGGVSGLQYADGSSRLKSVPLNPGSTQTVVSWSFIHLAVPAGPLTIKVVHPSSPVYSASISIVVGSVAPVPTPIPVPVPVPVLIPTPVLVPTKPRFAVDFALVFS